MVQQISDKYWRAEARSEETNPRTLLCAKSFSLFIARKPPIRRLGGELIDLWRSNMLNCS